MPHPGAGAILEATGATKSRAYELVDVLAAALPTLVRRVGRPKIAPKAPPPDRTAEATHEVLRYLLAHPGAAKRTGSRSFYSDGFRRHVLDLYARTELELDAFARAVDVPLGTLEDWLRSELLDDEAPSNESALPEDASLQIQTIIAAWRSWSGNFETFVAHVNEHLRILFGRSFIARVLFTYNERRPRHRAGRSPDEEATRDAFEVFFPNAQWVGDGMQAQVTINGERFDFNLELNVDAFSGAVVGASIRDEEDGLAVVEAFDDGVRTTGARPVALLLDNRSSNDTKEVDDALDDTMRMHSTLGRPQNKAHVEGAFGLFSQEAPPIDVNAVTPRELARELLRLRVQAFGRALNHRPRRDRNWKSRVDLHRGTTPTEEQVKAARDALEERRRKLERARDNDRQRADPVLIRFLHEAFERLDIVDPKGHARHAIARYGRDTTVDAIAIFEGKKNAGTLPDDVDAARYILGIAKNIAHVHEADAITLALARGRVAVRDAMLASLSAEHDRLLGDHEGPTKNLIRDLIDRAIDAERAIDRFFWIDATGAVLHRQPHHEQIPLFRDIARRIHATFAIPVDERATIERRLARIVWRIA